MRSCTHACRLIAFGVVLLLSPRAVEAQEAASDPLANFEWGPTAEPENDDEDRGIEFGLSLDLNFVSGLDGETQGIGVGQGAAGRLLFRPIPAVSLSVGGQATALYGDGAIAWIGTLAGVRLHWGELAGLDYDAWIEVNHVWGFSSSLSSHGVDAGLGIYFPFFDALQAGPAVHLQWVDDPDGTPVWFLTVGLSLVGWPMRDDADAPAADMPMSARRRAYVAPQSLRRAQARRRRSYGRAWILPNFEVFAGHALDDDHRDSIGLGGGASAAVEFPFLPWLGFHAGATGMALSAQSGNPAAWVGSQVGFRLHWTALAGIENDGWIDAHHVYGISGPITTHGADIGAGFSFDVAAFLRIGPMARVMILTDPGLDPAVMLSLGVTIAIRQPEAGPGNDDGDFLLDREDHCREIGVGDVEDPDNPGCPLLDRDGDGFADDVDMCTTEPAGDAPDATRPGCPLPDRDGDGVVDRHDFCPDTPQPSETMDPLRDGCPDTFRGFHVDGIWEGEARDGLETEPEAAEPEDGESLPEDGEAGLDEGAELR
ncbi:MAG: hypothetical protein AB8I08_35755 [Sandaracinaceae bacterium]